MVHPYTHISLDIFKVFDNNFHPYHDYITHNLFSICILVWNIKKIYIWLVYVIFGKFLYQKMGKIIISIFHFLISILR